MDINLLKIKAGEKFTAKSDVFQYGCVFWELMSDKMSFRKHKNKRKKINIVTGKNDFKIIFVSTQNIHKIFVILGNRPNLNSLKYSANMDHIKSIITQCWAQDKAERPTMQEVVLRLGVESQLPDNIFTREQNELTLIDAMKKKFMSLF